MESGEGPGKKQELWEKLRRVGKRGGQTTPVASYWRRNESGDSADPLTGGGGGTEEEHDRGSLNEDAPPFQFISSRKLAAALWELHHYRVPVDNMHHGGVIVPPPRLRRLKLNNQRSPPPGSPHDLLPESSSNLKAHVTESLMQHHRSIEKNHHALPTVSPTSTYGSSMEIAPYKPAVTPSISIELNERSGDQASSCLRTSTEMLKVLNHIWSLEKQHVANISLIKSLKKELQRARSQTKQLVREHQADRYQLDELMKHIREDKVVRKNKEQDRIDAAVQSMRDELEKERKLRVRSESLHRKLVPELNEAKTSLASISKRLEKERKSHDLLEDLCDEFAMGIKRCYGKEPRALRERADHEDEFIIHVSGLWLHEQMKAKMQPDELCVGEKKPTIDKLGSEIEAFLQSKRKINGNQVPRNPAFGRNSLESIPMNAGGDSIYFELEKTSESNSKSQGKKLPENHYEETMKQKLVSSDGRRELSPSSLQVKFQEHIAHATSYGVNRNQVEDAEQITNISQKTEIFEAAKEDVSERTTGLNSHAIHNGIRNGYPSPVREWREKLPAQDDDDDDFDIGKASSKENNLKAKLSEAKTMSQRPRSRRKASIIPSTTDE